MPNHEALYRKQALGSAAARRKEKKKRGEKGEKTFYSPLSLNSFSSAAAPANTKNQTKIAMARSVSTLNLVALFSAR